MTGYQIYKRLMAGESLFEICFLAERQLRRYLSRRDVRRGNSK